MTDAKLGVTSYGYDGSGNRTTVTDAKNNITIGIALIISVFMVGLRKDKRAIHDVIAGTYVTYEKP